MRRKRTKDSSSDSSGLLNLSMPSIGRTQANAIVLVALLLVSLPAMTLAGGIESGSARADTGTDVSGTLSDATIQNLNLDAQTAAETGDTVYVGSHDDSVHAIDADTGDQKWAYTNISRPGSSPTVVGGTVYIGSYTGAIYALDAETGDEEWVFNGTSDRVFSSPTVFNGTVYVGSHDTSIYAIDAETGNEEWEFTAPSGSLQSSPTVSNGTVYVGSDDGTLYAVDGETGTEEWAFTNPSDVVYSSPTVSNGTVYIGSDDATLYAVDGETGAEQWAFTTPSDRIRSSPTIADGTVYVGSDDGSVYAIDAETGDGAWSFTGSTDRIRSSPTVANGIVYIGSWDDSVYAIDAVAGTEEWTFTGSTNDIESSPTVGGGTVYIGSDDGSVYAIDGDTGAEEWVFTASTNRVLSSPTFVSGGSDHSDGSRVNLRTLGHHDETSFGSDPITGRVVDNHGDPVANATVLSHSITELALDESDARSLERQAEDLRDELTDPLPSSWDPDYDFDSHTDANGEYLLVHEAEDFGSNEWTSQQFGSTVDSPSAQVDSDQQVVLTLWDPSSGSGNSIDNSFPGATTDGTIVIEQKAPTGETTDRMEKDTYTLGQSGGGFFSDGRDIPGVRTSLPSGVYVAYPEGARERGYTFVVGSADELASAWESDLRDEANQLTQRAQRIRDLLGKDHVTQTTVKTNETGHFEISVPSNAVTTDLKAMKVDGQTLKAADNPSLENLREAQAGGYNGTFYLPSPEPNTVEPPAEGVEVTVYRSPEVPMGDMSSFADLMQFLENQRLNETVSELRSEYDQRLSEMENQTLEQTYKNHRTLVETVPNAEDRYLNRSTFSEIQDAEDLTNDELSTETRHMQVALATAGRIEPEVSNEDIIEWLNDSDELDLPEENITEADSYLRVDYPLPDSVDEDTVAPEIHWADGTVEPIPEKYWSIEPTGLFGSGGQQLAIEGFPVQSTDPGAFDIRVQAASSGSNGVGPIGGSDGGVLDDRVSATNPAFGGSLPEVNAIDFSTLAPGPSERVSVSVEAAPETGYGQLVSASAWNDDGKAINATIDASRDRASFTTDGAGVHQVRLTFENQQGDRFVLSERVRAHEQSRSDPATVRAATSTFGTHAVTGEQLASARIDASGTTLSIDVIAEDSDGPGKLHLKPANVMDGDENQFEVNVLHGSSEERVSAHVPVQLHLEGIEEGSALFWRSDAGFGGDPITWDGSTRYGQVEHRGDGKVVVSTYTKEDGSIELTTVENPGLRDRITHGIARRFGDFSLPFGMAVPGGFAVVVPVGLIARRRYTA